MTSFNAGDIEASLTLDRSRYQRELRRTQAEITKLEREEIKIKTDLETGVYDRKLAQLKREKEGLERQGLLVEADLEKARKWKKKTTELKAEMAEIERSKISVAAEITGVEKEIARVTARLQQIPDAKAQLEVDSLAAQTKLLAINNELRDFRGVHQARLIMNGPGNSSYRALSSTRFIIMGILSALPLVPAAAAPATAALAGLGGALAGAAGVAGVAGAAFVGAGIEMSKAMEGQADAREAVTAAEEKLAEARQKLDAAGTDSQRAAAARNLAEAEEELAEAQKNLADATAETAGPMGVAIAALDRLKASWNGFVDETSPAAFGLMAQGMDLLSDVLPRLVPLWEAVTPVIQGALDAVGAFFAGPEAERMFTFFGTVGVDSFRQFLNIGGNLLLFFGRLFEAFGPFIMDFMEGLADMTAGWAEWADGLGETEGFQSFMEYVADIGPKVVDMFVELFNALVNIGTAMAPISGPLVEGLTAIFEWISNLDPSILGTVVVGIGGAILAFQGLSAAIALVNLVMAANPFVLIAMAVVGLVGAIVYLWNTNETFREGVISAWNAIWDAIKPVVDWITGTMVPHLVEGWNTVWGYLQTAWNSIGAPVFYMISEVAGRVFGVIQWWIENVTLPILGLLWAGIQFTWNNVFKPVFGFIMEILGVAGSVVWWFWTSVIGPVFELVMAIIRKVWDEVFNPIFDWIMEKFDRAGTGFSYVWENVIKPVFNALMEVVRDKLAPAFEAGVSAAGAAWERLKDLARAPIRFVVDTIINQGLIKNFNKLADVFGTSHIDYLRLPGSFYGHSENAVGGRRSQGAGVQALASGGPVLGSSPTPTADNILARLTAGEFVLPVNAVARLTSLFGPGFLESLRRGLPGFAQGGLVDFGRMLQGMGYRVAEHPAFGGVAPVHSPNSLHYSGNAIDVNFAPGTSAREQAELAKIIPLAHAQGFRTIFMAPGHYGHAHIDTGRGGSIGSRLIGIGQAMMNAITDPMNFFREAVDGFAGRVGGGQFGQIALGMPSMLVDWFADRAKSMAGGLGDFATGIFDNGGQILPGYNLIYNGTGENEPVFTADQFRSRERETAELWAMVRALLAQGGTQPLVGGNLVLQAAPGQPVGDQFDEAMFKLKTVPATRRRQG